jgi:hypothetical protein
MCIGDPFPCGLPLCRHPGASLWIGTFQGAEAESVNDVNSHHHHTPQAIPGVPVNSSPSAAQPGRLFEDGGDTCDAPLPPAHVIDYWFDHLGLSLQTTPVENPSNSSTLPFSVPVTGGIDGPFCKYNTSHIMGGEFHFGLRVHCEGRLLIGFH